MFSLLLRILEELPLTEQLSFLLRYRKKTRAWLAAELEISEATLHHWISGKTRRIPPRFFPELAHLLGVPELLLHKGSVATPPSILPSAEILRENRVSLHLSISEVSRFLRLSAGLLSKWESCRDFPVPYHHLLGVLYTILSRQSAKPCACLASLRLHRRLSVPAAARKLNVPESTYWQWEWENAVPLDHLSAVAALFRVSVLLVPSSACRHQVNRPLALKALRNLYGISIREVISRTGLTGYQCYESGSAIPSSQNLTAVLSLFGTNPDSFFREFLRSVCPPRLDFLRKTRTPYNREELCRILGITARQYRLGLLPSRAAKGFCAITHSCFHDLFLPLTQTEQLILSCSISPRLIRGCRKSRQLSAQSAANLLSISLSTLRAYESGTRSPSLFTACRLASCYLTGIQQLLMV